MPSEADSFGFLERGLDLKTVDRQHSVETSESYRPLQNQAGRSSAARHLETRPDLLSAFVETHGAGLPRHARREIKMDFSLMKGNPL